MKVYFIYLVIYFVNIGCNYPLNHTEMNKDHFDRLIAIEYFKQYALLEKVDINKSIQINNDIKIRGEIGSAEFEYQEKANIFIVRGLINIDISKADIEFKRNLIDRLLKLNETRSLDFRAGKFEIDTTAYELDKKYPERINVRVDLIKPIEVNEFVKKVDDFMNEVY